MYNPRLSDQDPNQCPIYYVNTMGRITNALGRDVVIRIRSNVRKAKLHLRNVQERNIEVGQLVLDTFRGIDQQRPYVIHRDGNRLNNRIENVVAATREEYAADVAWASFQMLNEP
jgi:hypothetical protein